MKLAKEIPEIDIVVGGHSHTFLWPLNETQPSRETPRGPYPTYVEQDSGKIVPVVQAYCFSKYVGHFVAHFNVSGGLLSPVDGKGITDAKYYAHKNIASG